MDTVKHQYGLSILSGNWW